jgi:hypothetical protein
VLNLFRTENTMSKSGQPHTKADVGGQRSKTPESKPNPAPVEQGTPPQSDKLPPSSGKSGAKKG